MKKPLRQVRLCAAVTAGIAMALPGCPRKPDRPPEAAGRQPPAEVAAAEPGTARPAEHPLPPEWLSEPYLVPQIRSTRGRVRDVFVDGRNVTRFSRPHHIYEAKVSPCSRYLFVWHMDYTPRKVSTYDLEGRRKIATFEPGAGGGLNWAAHDLIYHHFGAGTNTALFAVYSVEGKTQWRGSTSGAVLCKSGRSVFTFPTLPASKEPIVVADVRNGRALAQARPDDIACMIEYRWLDGRTVRFWYETVDRATKTIDVKIAPGKPVALESADPVE